MRNCVQSCSPVERRRLATYGPRAFFGHFAVAEQQLTCFLYELPLFVLCALLGCRQFLFFSAQGHGALLCLISLAGGCVL